MTKRGPNKALSFVAESFRRKPEQRENQISIEKVSSFEEFINAIDFEALNDVLEQIARKSRRKLSRRVKREDVVNDTEALERISQERGLELHGGADPVQFKVHFSWNEHVGSAEKIGIPPGVLALHILVHEITHLYARRGTKLLEPGDEDLRVDGPAIHSVTGYEDRQFGVDTPEVSRVAVSLNEAVTEELGLEVFNEYVRRVGESTMFASNPDARKIISTRLYASDRFLLQATISALARRVGVDRDLVWRGFVQGYINGEEKSSKLVADIMRHLVDHPASSLLTSQLLEERALSGNMHKVTEGFERGSIEEAADKIIDSIETDSIEDALGLR